MNLLPVQNKRSRDPGDSKEMVAARRRFLEAGHYQPIADAVAQAVLAGAVPGRTLTCLDAGCGEGYYLRQLAATAAAEARPLALAGLDISKWAVQAAAKRDLQDARSQAGASASPEHHLDRRQQRRPAGAAGHARPRAVHVRLPGLRRIRPRAAPRRRAAAG